MVQTSKNVQVAILKVRKATNPDVEEAEIRE